jgi:predicted amidohydrolase YtcJ
VTSPNPWIAIYQALTREGENGVLNAEERIDRQTMFYAYTANAARTLGLEQQIGTLASGKYADFIVLDRDVFSVSDKELRDTRVLKTFFGGREVYTATAP